MEIKEAVAVGLGGRVASVGKLFAWLSRKEFVKKKKKNMHRLQILCRRAGKLHKQTKKNKIFFHISHFTFHISLFTFHISHFTFHFSHFTFHISHFTFHISHFTFHISLYTFHISQNKKKILFLGLRFAA